MIASFLITFRETLEAALIIGIIFAYLSKTNRTKYNNLVGLGIASSIIASILVAILFQKIAGGFEGRAEQIFEAFAMLLASILLTFMILWMLRQKHIQKSIEEHVEKDFKKHHKFGLFFVTFISVFREGVETVIFLGAARFISNSNPLFGAITGVITAIILGYLIFAGSKKLQLKTFFNITSVLLILFAAGLVAHSTHEFQEADLLPIYVENLFDINPELNIDGSYPLLHEKGTIGTILKGLFGYNGNPSLLEIISYLSYLILISIIWRKLG